MADTDTANAPSDADPDNKEVVVALAVRVLQTRGWIEEPYDELLDGLERLYDANPDCQIEVEFNGDPWHDMHAGRPGEYLAVAFEDQCRENNGNARRRSAGPAPAGSPLVSTCGTSGGPSLYTCTDTGLFDTDVTSCPRCNRDLNKARADTKRPARLRVLAEPQAGATTDRRKEVGGVTYPTEHRPRPGAARTAPPGRAGEVTPEEAEGST